MENKTILNEYGEKLYVEIYEPLSVKSTIIFCHGITGCRKGRTRDDSYFQTLAKKLQDLNYKVVLFDFSGHGDSQGNDYDVCISKSTKELESIFNSEVIDKTKVSFLVFSYGAIILCNFLNTHKDIYPQQIVMYSPCLFPLESCFLNSNSVFGKDIVRDKENGNLDKFGYATVGVKNFRFGKNMLAECKNFSPKLYSEMSNKILVLSGENDSIMDTKYNADFCKTYNIKNIWFATSHSLFEDINNVIEVTINYFEFGSVIRS